MSGYEATFRLSSRARRVSQRERGVVAYMRDARGRRYDGKRGPADPPFDVRFAPLETVLTERRFFLPREVKARDIVIALGGVPFPGCCIIGEANSLVRVP